MPAKRFSEALHHEYIRQMHRLPLDAVAARIVGKWHETFVDHQEIQDLKHCLDKLLYFKAVCDAGSIHGAAQALRIAQPSVSYAIKVLEDVLETPLFFRERRGVRLTESGTKLHRYTEEIFRIIQRADEDVREPEDPLAGTIKVGAYDIFAVHLLPLVMAKFQKSLPQMRIEVEINNSNGKLMTALMKDEIHLAVMALPKPTKALTTQPLYTERFAFFAGRDAPEVATLNWLKERSLVVFGQAIATTGRTISDVLRQLQLSEAVRHDLASFDAVLSFAGQGLGVALAPEILTEQIIRQRGLKRVKIRGLKESDFGAQRIGVVTTRHNISSPKVTAFTQALMHQFDQ